MRISDWSSDVCSSDLFPLASPSRPDAAKPLDSRRLRLYDGAMEIALFQPDIAGNVGTILRTAACFGAPAHIIEPCGFPFGDAALKRAGMDYAVRANVRRPPEWDDFRIWSKLGRPTTLLR